MGSITGTCALCGTNAHRGTSATTGTSARALGLAQGGGAAAQGLETLGGGRDAGSLHPTYLCFIITTIMIITIKAI
eukprot:COSAG01_NODE_35331_length_533_cov_1.543779_1_plen_76_part_00